MGKEGLCNPSIIERLETFSLTMGGRTDSGGEVGLILIVGGLPEPGLFAVRFSTLLNEGFVSAICSIS